MNEKILFFTCAYNAENYLRRAMDSIVNQTYPNWIYYVLDNGSTDGTGAIIRDYERRDGRIRGLSVKQNDVNNLFDTPFGKNDILPDTDYDYLAILDADDEYMTEFASETLSFARENAADVVVAASDNDLHPGARAWGYDSDRILTTDDFKDLPGWYKIINPAWGKLYHRSVTQKIRRERISTNDFEIVLEALLHCEKAGIVRKILHRQYIRRRSGFHTWDSAGISTHKFNAVEYFDILRRFMLEKCGDVSKRSEDLLYYRYTTLSHCLIEILWASELSADSKRAIVLEMLDFDRTKQLMARADFGSEMQDPGICLEARGRLLKRIAYCVADKNEIDSESNALLLSYCISNSAPSEFERGAHPNC
jgi:glycosyltransferase involved in cell wall biosynthesis